MEVHKIIQSCRDAVEAGRERGQIVGLVPTMGALHAGHLSLIEAARRRCDLVVVTLFVNPTQFGPGEDLTAYPRDFDGDVRACESAGVGMLFAPTTDIMYPGGEATTVHVARLTEHLCGASRPGHFDGVTTVVTKLFHIAPAHLAFFGEKDYQQLVVIRKMAADLNMPIEIVGCPIVREPDGLAMSSRNAYLNPDERGRATVLFRALTEAQARVAEGNVDSGAVLDGLRRTIGDAGMIEVEYAEIVEASTLTPLTIVDRPARICLAARLGRSRLIDNVAVDPPGDAG
ncbi:MAG: pantoate--beta-alanine ligase [Phycisphaerae bacterium]